MAEKRGEFFRLIYMGTTKHENGDSIRGAAPLAGGWGCPPAPSNIPPRMGGRGVERVIFEGRKRLIGGF